jgi:tungstate transport system ATP-binding protein
MHGAAGILPLEAEGLGYAAGGRMLLAGISFHLDPGPRTVILGPNGAGKSLLLRLCHGLLTPTAGSVSWRGVLGDRAKGRHAMVFQRPVMLRRSVFANMTHALALAGCGRAERCRRAAEALTAFGLGALADRPARVLSGGEQQRLALARTWALRPEVLFLDEPTAFLDPAATRAIETEIARFHQDGTRIVMTTHDLGQARRIADEILFLHRGRLLERSDAATFFRGPRSPEAAAFLRGELTW